MPLHTKVDGDGPDGQRLAIDPLLAGDGESVPKHRLPDIPMSPDMAYEIVHDELMLDGNARLNLPRVASINTSGHKYGRVYPGVGWAIWRDPETLPEELVFRVNYLGGPCPRSRSTSRAPARRSWRSTTASSGSDSRAAGASSRSAGTWRPTALPRSRS